MKSWVELPAPKNPEENLWAPAAAGSRPCQPPAVEEPGQEGETWPKWNAPQREGAGGNTPEEHPGRGQVAPGQLSASGSLFQPAQIASWMGGAAGAGKPQSESPSAVLLSRESLWRSPVAETAARQPAGTCSVKTL
ncbi:hypothetical protein [Kamptonema formosum]|uniref:hypothetical protein n=1 Tax=Kamptonema formosum TaxID=331992 RepID=UPI000345D15F|nr:hypothetical protein [Oscillatoria sp. PCC 10802]